VPLSAGGSNQVAQVVFDVASREAKIAGQRRDTSRFNRQEIQEIATERHDDGPAEGRTSVLTA
jgi:hypothetical protein